jgi:FtsP/CotA-like multicopper oxidase with cupredoxin domain
MEKGRSNPLPCWRFFCALLFSVSGVSLGKAVTYDLTATQGTVNLSGKKEVDFALLVNGTIPAPTLEFTEGDEAVIHVTNHIPEQELSIHWHGILLPPEMDGVPYVTTPPIKSGKSFTFRFKLRQSGTYWYHSHTNVQEQKGVYGGIIIHPKKKTLHYDKDAVVVLSDWSDEDALSILKNLRKDGDYYLYKKNTIRSWWGALQANSLGNYLYNEWTRMGGMDLSDVGYDAFLINGKRDSQLLTARTGERIRIRVVNAAASSYFYVSLGQEPMTVVSSDGIDTEPVRTKEILLGMAETYDVLFQMPDQKNFELKATAQDSTGSASAWIGEGEKVFAPVKPQPDLYATMDHSSHGQGHSNHHGMHHSAPVSRVEQPKQVESTPAHHSSKMDSAPSTFTIADTLTVDKLKSPQSTEFPPGKQVYELKLVLNGDMSRYIWFLNGKTIHQDRTISIREQDIVRFIFENQTMMHHPMHLHGHFFRVLNDAGERSPLKHTVDVPPHGTRTIEFYANEPGEWMLHCHNLYHLKTGMARVVKYESYQPSSELQHLQKHDPHHHDHFYFMGFLEAATNHAQGHFHLSQTWHELELRFETRRDWSWNGEGDLFYRRWFNRYLSVVGGGTGVDGQFRAVLGVSYLLPMLIHADLFIDHRGEFRLDIEKRFQWTKYLFTDVDVTLRQKLESEFEVSLMFSPSWSWAAGLKYTGDSFGAGVHYQF